MAAAAAPAADDGRPQVRGFGVEITKGEVGPPEAGRSNVCPTGEDDQPGGAGWWAKREAVTPPVDLDELWKTYAASYALRPLIDVYAVNIDGNPHTLELRLDPADDSPETTQAIRDAILIERMWDWGATGAVPGALDLEITDAEVEGRRREITVAARVEKLRLDMFFAQPCPGYGLIQLRKMLRHDLEVHGNAYVEVLRNPGGQITQLLYVPAHTMRLVQLGGQTKATWRRRVTPVSYRPQTTWVRHRHYVQQQENGTAVYFKALGEPGVFSAATNKRYPSEAAMKASEHDARMATEMVHLRLFDSSGPYGLPRWQGAIRAVQGSRLSEDFNRGFFLRGTIPPGLLLVSGGRGLSKATQKKLEMLLTEQRKSAMDRWTLVTIEALGPETGAVAPQTKPPSVTLEWVPLTGAQPQDALFQEYDARNEEKVRKCYRLPKLLIGDQADANRSTSEAALRYANEQVFQPERDDFDAVINDQLFPAMDVRYWKFASHGPKQRDIATVAEVLERLRFAITPNEMRPLIAELLQRELPRIAAAWGDRPERIYLGELQAGIQQLQAIAHGRPGAVGEADATGVAASSELGQLLSSFGALRDRLESEVADRQQAEIRAARAATAQAEPERVTLSAPPELVDELLKEAGECGSSDRPA